MQTKKAPQGAIWITGISAAGKSTLGEKLCEKFRLGGFDNLVFLDGEEIRKHLDRPYGRSVEERFLVAKNIVRIASEKINEGKLVVVATISHKISMREMARQKLEPFMEVFLQCPVEICMQRDYKGHYQRAIAGEYEVFIGITDPYETYDRPELILDTANLSINVCSEILYQKSLQFFSLNVCQPDAACFCRGMAGGI